jgi:antitoxin component YwqK of YwqJK toxin-antitoxin module
MNIKRVLKIAGATIFIAVVAIYLYSYFFRKTEDVKYPNGNPSNRYSYKLDLKDWTFVKDGTASTWYENGKMKTECVYRNGILTGPMKEWYENGQLKSECAYENDDFYGPVKEWYEKGQLKSECNYENGNQIGPMKEWYEKGQLKSECNYENGNQIGPMKEWYEKGQLKSECNYENDNRNGPMKEWYENGKLKFECTYKDDKYFGPCTEWYESGVKKSEYSLTEDWDHKKINNGLCREWNENGQEQLAEFYVNDFKLPKLDAVAPVLSTYLLINTAIPNGNIKMITNANNIVGYCGMSNLLQFWFQLDEYQNIYQAMFHSILNPENSNSINFIANAGACLIKALSRNGTLKYYGEDVLWPAISHMMDNQNSAHGELYQIKTKDTVHLGGYFKWWPQSEFVDTVGFIPLNKKTPKGLCVLFLEFK